MKTKNKLFNYIIYTFITSLILVACTDDDDGSVNKPITPNEEELITTVNVVIGDSSSLPAKSYSFRDLDGDGGNAPTIDTIKLGKGQTFNVSLQFWDESDTSNVEDITVEVLQEDDEHLICFDTNSVSGLSINRTDSDGMFEVGLQSTWVTTTGASSTNGSVKITLKHQPSMKDGSCTPGDTDIEVQFPIQIN